MLPKRYTEIQSSDNVFIDISDSPLIRRSCMNRGASTSKVHFSQPSFANPSNNDNVDGFKMFDAKALARKSTLTRSKQEMGTQTDPDIEYASKM